MGEYQHLKFVERTGTNSMKWDWLQQQFGRSDLLAAWVADMDIEAPACVRDALRDLVDFNVFGYYRAPESYYDAFMAWEREQHGYLIQREWIRHIPGVVPGLYWAVSMFTEPGEAVAVMTPVYYPFMNAIKDTGRCMVDIPLVLRDGMYTMDLDGFEKAVTECDVKLFILCSPHNPVGRVWTKEELRGVLDICKQHGVYVVSDEIHHDLIMPGNTHVVSAMVGDYDDVLITLLSASKTFNLAGCMQAFAVIADEALRNRFDAFLKEIRLGYGTPFGYVAYEAAYRGGLPWLQELLQLIWDNYCILTEGLGEALPKATVTPLQGTYLAWVNVGAYLDGCDVEATVIDTCDLALDFGPWFGGEAYGDYVRINLATSPKTVREIVRRLSLMR
ncbi:MAG: pyridoxal phosphate-dependent aminotransferase [Eggerthellaceae bacterium]|nr:pyridoxal phosphate-dependent aminotransferase [Eggerthellaceae bacterium]